VLLCRQAAVGTRQVPVLVLERQQQSLPLLLPAPLLLARRAQTLRV
jgi:hypothetical protein